MNQTRTNAYAMVLAQINKLVEEYPGMTVPEIYDAMITAGYDLKKTRELCDQAKEAGMDMAQLLAMYECKKVRE